MSNKSDTLPYPEPFVVQPQIAHKRSLILLHGRGSTGSKFGEELMHSRTSLTDGLGISLPDTKFIFPTARKRRAKWYNRATISQWFDSVPIDEQDSGVNLEQEEWQLEGLRQSRAFLKTIVDAEVSFVGAANVFIGGLSQGCAMALHLLLSLETPQPRSQDVSETQHLGGFVGMSSWLPFADAIEAIIRPESNRSQDFGDDEDDPFGAPSETDTSPEESTPYKKAVVDNKAHQVCNLVRDNMDLPPLHEARPSWVQTPILLGHGKNDEKVGIGKGLRAAQCLRDVGLEVTWKEYDEGHWYKVPDQLDDIVAFVDGCRR